MLLGIGDIVAERYELVEEIGRGGFGYVYRARQFELERDVAIKILYPPDDPTQLEQVRARFRREALMVSNLNHPHTIRQYDFGENEHGVMYFVMEYLRGRTLDDALSEDGPMNDARVAHIARGVLKSLGEAHSQNIVHRDLKPGNIMLCDIHGESDFIKVLDFGIAKTTLGKHDIT
ncbi:MAG: serine/threonine-protein kinase, partial [Bradymonadaceae bacterium]